MYGQNLGGRPDANGEPIFTKFCLRVRIPDVFLSFEFQKDRMKNVGAVGGRNFAPPVEKAHRLYNSLLLPHKPWKTSAGPSVHKFSTTACTIWGSENKSGGLAYSGCHVILEHWMAVKFNKSQRKL